MVVVGVRLSRGIRSLDANGSTAPSIVSACKVSRTAQRHADVPHCSSLPERTRSTKTRLGRARAPLYICCTFPITYTLTYLSVRS